MANSKIWADPDTHFNGQGRNDMRVVYLLSPSTGKIIEPAISTGGNIGFHLITAASNNATSIKGTPGTVYGYEIFNASAAIRYVKLYNKATAPAPATDNALLRRVIGIPAGGRVNATLSGLAFSAGIGIAAVTGISDTDNTSVAASDLSIDIEYL